MQKVLFILGELSDDDIDWLIAAGAREELPAGHVLIREGQSVDALYLMLEGSLSVSVGALGGKEIAQLVSGDVVGEMSFIDARPPSATVTALTSALVLSIPRQQLEQRLHLDVGFASRFYRALAVLLSNRLRGTVRYIGDERGTKITPASEELSGSPSETVAIAKARFDWLLRRLRTGAIEGHSPN